MGIDHHPMPEKPLGHDQPTEVGRHNVVAW